jgi:hypothetical protein
MLRRTWPAMSGVAHLKKPPGLPVAWMATSVPSVASSSSYRTSIGNGRSTVSSTSLSGSCRETTYPTASRPGQPGLLVQGATVERTAKFLGRTFTYATMAVDVRPVVLVHRPRGDVAVARAILF